MATEVDAGVNQGAGSDAAPVDAPNVVVGGFGHLSPRRHSCSSKEFFHDNEEDLWTETGRLVDREPRKEADCHSQRSADQVGPTPHINKAFRALSISNDSPTDLPSNNQPRNRKGRGFEDAYTLTGRFLGAGAFAVVEECQRNSDAALCAVKTMKKDEVDRDKVMKEYEILLECGDHPNIVLLYDFFETPANYRFVFEELRGGELLDHVVAMDIVTEHDASNVIADVAEALRYMHSKGIAHRDLKPQNILCANETSLCPVKICDFNLAIQKPPTFGKSAEVVPVGTPEFMSPEIAEAVSYGEKLRFDKSCDVWSLGVVMYILLCGYPPFTGDCGTDCGWRHGNACPRCSELLLDSIQDGFFEFPRAEWRRVSGAAKDLIARMLVRADQRLRTFEVLRHPWIAQKPGPTPLATADVLRRQKASTGMLNDFTAHANKEHRKMTPRSSRNTSLNTSADLISPAGAERSEPIAIAPFNLVSKRSLEDIHTPQIRASRLRHDSFTTISS